MKLSASHVCEQNRALRSNRPHGVLVRRPPPQCHKSVIYLFSLCVSRAGLRDFGIHLEYTLVSIVISCLARESGSSDRVVCL